jgi:hypothetical protein
MDAHSSLAFRLWRMVTDSGRVAGAVERIGAVDAKPYPEGWSEIRPAETLLHVWWDHRGWPVEG